MKTSHKLIAAGLALAAALVHLISSGYPDWNAGGSTAYVLLLLGLFFSREEVNDERVQGLKLQALTVAFMIGYTVAFGSKMWLRYQPHEGLVTLSAYDLMFVILAAASGLFHYWRWQDGRTDPLVPDEK